MIATGYASTVRLWPHLFGHELSIGEQEQLFADFRRVARIVQIPAGHFPDSRAEFWTYFGEMVSTTLVNHAVAQDIISNQLLGAVPAPPRVIPPGWSRLWWPAGIGLARALYLLGISLLPPAVRDKLEVGWTLRDAAAAKALWASMRLSTRYLPDRANYTPVAYHSIRRARAIDAIRHRALTSFV